MNRIDFLRETNAQVKFLSCEPLIGPLDGLNLENIDWVTVGGESGFKARFMNPNWVLSIQKVCCESTVPFFFKQWGGQNKKEAGRVLNGRTYDEMPRHVA
jgi:protein gp37